MSRSAQFCWCGHPPRLPSSPGATSPETAWVRARVGQFEIANPKTAQDCETRPVLMLVGSLGPDCDGGAAGIQRFSRNINRLGYDPEKRERDPTIRDYGSSETPPNRSMATARQVDTPRLSPRPRPADPVHAATKKVQAAPTAAQVSLFYDGPRSISATPGNLISGKDARTVIVRYSERCERCTVADFDDPSDTRTKIWRSRSVND